MRTYLESRDLIRPLGSTTREASVSAIVLSVPQNTNDSTSDTVLHVSATVVSTVTGSVWIDCKRKEKKTQHTTISE